jgi:hypothetical protein
MDGTDAVEGLHLGIGAGFGSERLPEAEDGQQEAAAD